MRVNFLLMIVSMMHVQCFAHVSIVYCAYQSWVHFLFFIYSHIHIVSCNPICNVFLQFQRICFFFSKRNIFPVIFLESHGKRNRHSFSARSCIIGKFHIIFCENPGKRNEKKTTSLKHWTPVMVRCSANRTGVNRKSNWHFREH